MNYYIIPKNNFNISINPIIKRENISPIISYSLIHHLNTIFSQIFHYLRNGCNLLITATVITAIV